MTDSAPSHRRAQILLGVIGVGVVAVAIVVAPMLWEWASLKWIEEHYKDGSLRLRRQVLRWGRHAGKGNGKWIEFYPNGLKKEEAAHWHGYSHGVFTSWNEAGNVIKQIRYAKGKRLETRTSPPWWNGVKDQRP